MIPTALSALVVLGAASAVYAAAPTMDAMRDHRRVILIAASQPHDPQALAQRRILSAWQQQAADRDITLVEVSSAGVSGAGDDATALEKRYGLKPGRFQVLLIGKDGHVALRSDRPVAAETLQGTIDAMPMRQAGER